MEANLFKAKLIDFYSSWINYKNRLWGNSDVLVVFNPLSSNQPYLVSSAFFTWLLGHDLPATIAVFSPNSIYLLTNNCKSLLLRSLVAPSMEAVGATLSIRPMYGSSDRELNLMDEIVREIREDSYYEFGFNQRIVVGYIQGESPNPELIWGGENDESFQSVAVSGFFSLLNGDDEEFARFKGGGVIQMEALSIEFEQTLLLAPAGGTPPMEAKIRREEIKEDEEWVMV